MMTETIYDIMIIGSGPAGLTAGIYGQRLGLKTIVFGDIPGGNVYMIENLENFPGFPGGVTGAQFGVTIFQQAQQEGATCTLSRLDRLDRQEGSFVGTDADQKTFLASSVIVAAGRVPKRLKVANAHLKGAHFCSICDGPLYRGKNATLAVVGSDNTASQHALSLARIADRVLLIHRSDDSLMDAAHKRLVDRQAGIEVMAGTEVTGYLGLDMIEGLVVSSDGGAQRELPIDGLFLAVGWRPNTGMLNIPLEATADGYLKTDENMMTSCPGVFAAGDVRDTDMWQVLTACADGARVAKCVAEFLGQRSSSTT